jgi:hypothetical protein
VSLELQKGEGGLALRSQVCPPSMELVQQEADTPFMQQAESMYLPWLTLLRGH